MMKAKMMAGGGMMKKGYAAGGMPMVEKDGKKVPAFAADGKGKMAKGGMAKMTKSEASSKMGKVKTSPKPDGVAVKGKTKGTMVKMAAGGKAKMMKSGGAC
jgi:hypothetical protein